MHKLAEIWAVVSVVDFQKVLDSKLIISTFFPPHERVLNAVLDPIPVYVSFQMTNRQVKWI